MLEPRGWIPDVSAKDVSAKTWRRTFRQKKYAETSQANIICRNVWYDMWGISGVCTLAFTVAKTECTPFKHGNKFERMSSSFIFEWIKFEFSKNRNKFESLFSSFELSIKRASDFSSFHLVLRGPFGPLIFPSC